MNLIGMFQEKWLRASDHSFTGANLRWKSYTPDSLKHSSALALPQWAHSQYCTIVTNAAHFVMLELFRHYMSRLHNFSNENTVERLLCGGKKILEISLEHLHVQEKITTYR